MSLFKIALYFMFVPGFVVAFAYGMTDYSRVDDPAPRYKRLTLKNVTRALGIAFLVGAALGLVGLAAGALGALLR